MLQNEDKKGHRTPLSPRIWPLVVTAFVISAIVLPAVFAQRLLWDFSVHETASDSEDTLKHDAFLVEARLRERVNDLFFLRSVAEDELVRIPQTTVATNISLRNAIKAMMLTRSQFDKISVLDLQGREIFRYNWVGGSNPIQEVSPSEFQDKSDRPFYRETAEAPANAVVYSPLELTLEHDQIVEPFKPVVRVSGLIAGPDGQPFEIIVLNYRADALLQGLREDTGEHHQVLVLNSDGFWLSGPTAASEWAFMYSERKSETIAIKDPQLWKQLTASKTGWFEKDGFLYCFDNIDPVNDSTDAAPLRAPVLLPQK